MVDRHTCCVRTTSWLLIKVWQFWLIYNNFVGSKSFLTKLGLKIILNYKYWANEIGTYFDAKMSDYDPTFADIIPM